MSRLVLVRHGESVWNATQRLQGQADPGLSATGRHQAALLRPLVERLAADHVVLSDLRRARETASLLGVSGRADARWREREVGDWTGATVAALRRQQATRYAQWRDGAYTPPGAESWQVLMGRIETALADCPTEGTTLVVTHGGCVRAACHVLVGLDPARVVPVAPASITLVERRPKQPPRLLAYNLLPAERVPPGERAGLV